jgi:hypothetical protein
MRDGLRRGGFLADEGANGMTLLVARAHVGDVLPG